MASGRLRPQSKLEFRAAGIEAVTRGEEGGRPCNTSGALWLDRGSVSAQIEAQQADGDATLARKPLYVALHACWWGCHGSECHLNKFTACPRKSTYPRFVAYLIHLLWNRQCPSTQATVSLLAYIVDGRLCISSAGSPSSTSPNGGHIWWRGPAATSVSAAPSSHR